MIIGIMRNDVDESWIQDLVVRWRNQETHEAGRDEGHQQVQRTIPCLSSASEMLLSQLELPT